MSDKILVTYATRSGSTAGVAEAIGKTLAENGQQVDVCRMQDIDDLSPYRAVVVGSAIQGGKWLPEAMQFLQTHQQQLRQKKFAAFLVCITLTMNEKYHQGVRNWMDPVRSFARPVHEGYFAGMLDFSKMPLTLNTFLMRLVVAFGLWAKGDHRDWEAIRSWAEDLKPLL